MSSKYNPLEDSLRDQKILAESNIHLRYPEVNLKIYSHTTGKGIMELTTFTQNATGSRLILVREVYEFDNFNWKSLTDMRRRFESTCVLHLKNYIFTQNNSIAEPHKNLIRKI